ncbi:MAG: hypothetical protein AB7O38_27850, partial [Pirellulaceae bacterium]
MLARWSIRRKFGFGVTLITLIVGTLSVSGIVSVYSYREVVRTISARAAELPLALGLTKSIERLAATYQQGRKFRSTSDYAAYSPVAFHEEFRVNLMAVSQALIEYRGRIERVELGKGISDNRNELAALDRLEDALTSIRELYGRGEWGFDANNVDDLEVLLETLREEADEIPGYLHNGMQNLKSNARGEYHALIASTWATSVLSVVTLLLLLKYLYDWVVCPLGTVILAARQ